MSKLINQLNQIWYETDGERVKMGLTRSFLDTLDECWHIIPAQRGRIREKAPLFTVETNDSLVSVLSPVAGSFLTWNDRATNFPDKLTDNDVLIELTTKALPEVVELPLAVLREQREEALQVANGTGPVRVRQDAVARYHELGTMIEARTQATPARSGGFVTGVMAAATRVDQIRADDPIRGRTTALAMPQMNWDNLNNRITANTFAPAPTPVRR